MFRFSKGKLRDPSHDWWLPHESQTNTENKWATDNERNGAVGVFMKIAVDRDNVCVCVYARIWSWEIFCVGRCVYAKYYTVRFGTSGENTMCIFGDFCGSCGGSYDDGGNDNKSKRDGRSHSMKRGQRENVNTVHSAHSVKLISTDVLGLCRLCRI